MFGLGTTELVIVAFVIVLLFGSKKLPQLGRSLGGAITSFKKGLNDDPEKEKLEKEEDDTSKNA